MVGGAWWNGGLNNCSVLHNIMASTGLVRSQVSFSPDSAQVLDKGVRRHQPDTDTLQEPNRPGTLRHPLDIPQKPIR